MDTVSCLYLKTIIKNCVGQGADPDEVYSFIDGGEKTLENSSLRLDGSILTNILEVTARHTNDETITLKIGGTLRPDSLDDVGYAITFCDDLHEVMGMITKYQSISQCYGMTKLHVNSKAAKIVWKTFDADNPRYYPYVDLVFSGYATVGRWLLWQSENPINAVEFRRPRPNDTRVYESVFGKEITFGADQDVMHFDAKLAHVPLPSRNPEIKNLMRRRLDVQLANVNAKPSMTYRARRCVTSELSKGRPEIDKTAAILGQSERTFRRKLAQEGTSFRQVLEEVYIEACEIFLRNQFKSHAQIALSLGFSDQTAYTRAFRRWFGTSPQNYRKQIVSQGEILTPVISVQDKYEDR